MRPQQVFEALLDALMWTPTTRAQHGRAGLRHGSDLTDAEWAVLKPLLPPPCDCGRPRRWPLREMVNAIFYVPRGSCPWRMLPKDLPPWRTAYCWFARLRNAGTWGDLNFALVMADRERSGRSASPSAAVMDSQSVRTTESGGPRGYNAGKKVWGRKRYAMADTDGRPPFADSGYAGERGGCHDHRHRDCAQAGWATRLCRPAPALGHRPHLPGWAATAASPATSRPPLPQPPPFSTPLPSCCSPESSAVPHEFRHGP